VAEVSTIGLADLGHGRALPPSDVDPPGAPTRITGDRIVDAQRRPLQGANLICSPGDAACPPRGFTCRHFPLTKPRAGRGRPLAGNPVHWSTISCGRAEQTGSNPARHVLDDWSCIVREDVRQRSPLSQPFVMTRHRNFQCFTIGRSFFICTRSPQIVFSRFSSPVFARRTIPKK
jgi:hypothetical protein